MGVGHFAARLSSSPEDLPLNSIQFSSTQKSESHHGLHSLICSIRTRYPAPEQPDQKLTVVISISNTYFSGGIPASIPLSFSHTLINLNEHKLDRKAQRDVNTSILSTICIAFDSKQDGVTIPGRINWSSWEGRRAAHLAHRSLDGQRQICYKKKDRPGDHLVYIMRKACHVWGLHLTLLQ